MQGCALFLLKLLGVFYTSVSTGGRGRGQMEGGVSTGLWQGVAWTGIEEVPGPVCEDSLLQGPVLHTSSAFKASNGISRKGVRLFTGAGREPELG